jgi:hypothetical protein
MSCEAFLHLIGIEEHRVLMEDCQLALQGG